MKNPAPILALAALLAFMAGAAFAQSQERNAGRNPPAVTVPGEATMERVPDVAIVQAGVTAREKTAREAMAASGKTTGAILASLRQGGITDRDIRTSNLKLEPIYEQRDRRQSKLEAVEATSLVSVHVRDVAKAAEILDRMMSAGANVVNGIQFTVSSTDKLLDAARAEAFADARRKAEIYAKAAGLRLGRALSIEEGSTGRPFARATLASRDASMPVAPGSETFSVGVNVSFELLP